MYEALLYIQQRGLELEGRPWALGHVGPRSLHGSVMVAACPSQPWASPSPASPPQEERRWCCVLAGAWSRQVVRLPSGAQVALVALAHDSHFTLP